MPMILSYACCNVGVMPVRKEPYHTAEQVTQLLFGEKAEIMQVNNRDWAKIRCGWDDYEGWCKLSQLSLLHRKEYRKEVKYLSGDHKGRLLMPGEDMQLPLGAELLGIKAGLVKAAHLSGKFKGKKLNVKQAIPGADAVKAAAMQYLHAPYQWGGRSVAGLDCSGLVQMAYKICNYPMPRDASQQAMVGSAVDFLVHTQCGDLAFFEEKEGSINHVGILLDNETIIHATDTAGRVVIDRIDQQGIISISLKKRTHHLRMVKRVLPAQ
ncbi:C40 family peptidase [Nemorincola caseinilytica]|uniref:C40 family peptidase n=1 Tax=Nemorincola caseinilytica TaxID=2054315 RepID=A0ABP8NIG5_9BACT